MKESLINACLNKKMKWKDAAKVLNMHPKALSRLKKKYLKYGNSALLGKKPGPKKGIAHNKTDGIIEDIIVKLALFNNHLGPVSLAEKLEEEYGITKHATTIWRILKRKTNLYLGEYLSLKNEHTRLFCLDEPGEELQIDACFPFGRAKKCACFSAIDDCSRYVFSRCYEKENTETAIIFITELINRMPFNISTIRVDNRYSQGLEKYCEEVLGVKVIRNDAYMPIQNGKVERFNRTIKNGFFFRWCKFTSSIEEINYQLQHWVFEYNYKRKHKGFGMNGLTPAQKIASTRFLLINRVIYPQKVTGTLQQYKP
jgi:hypothetical protein